MADAPDNKISTRKVFSWIIAGVIVFGVLKASGILPQSLTPC